MAHPFKAYDVRGIYGKDVTEELAYKVGRAFVQYLKAKTVVVGMDMRNSSVPLSNSLIEGLTDAGADVVNIGLCSTDMLYFASINIGTDGGIMVTASHNPSEYNGLKFIRQDAIPIGLESGLADIEAIIVTNKIEAKKTKGKVTKQNLLPDFIKFMHSFVNIKDLHSLNVVIDAGNGMSGMIFPELLKGSSLKITPMYFDLDGSFPNHEANPLEEHNRVDLVNKVKQVGADIGIGMDGDADRAFFVDSDGTFCDGDFILAILAKEFLKKKPNAHIIYDVRCSRYVKDTVAKMGGTSTMWKVGHAYAKLKLRELNADFGGEVSGHYYYKYKTAYFDSGCLTALLLLKVLSDNNITLKEAMKETKSYFVSGEINSKVKDTDAKIEEIKKMYKGKAEILEVDGISIITKDWWANIRKSNTEPLLRLNCEAYSKQNMEKIRDEFLRIIRS